MDFSGLKDILNKLTEKLNKLKSTLNLEEKYLKIKELEQLTLEEGFWGDVKNSSKVLTEIKQQKNIVLKIEKLETLLSDALEYLDLANEMNDIESFKEAEKISKILNAKLENLEIDTLLSEEYDSNNAIVTIHPGAGGTESQDWADMLYRMYMKWCLKSEFEVEVLDFLAGEEAGIKSVSFLVKGINCYGYLKSENGVHRLVRISPFDSNSRRHTSFAAVEILPEIADDVVVDIKPEDIEMDVFRASGAGGQHVNKTSSAVRIRHIPSGIVIACQNERSQIQNREYAMKMLKSKLYKLERDNYQNKLNNIKGDTTDNAWGNQIRSYVFCPYTLVKDHRTNFEIGNVQAVMDGKIDEFIFEYLKNLKKNDII